jgi:SSS family solute:Na+ symporter
MLKVDANVLDYLIIGIYFAVVVGIGFAAKRLIKTPGSGRLRRAPGT